MLLSGRGLRAEWEGAMLLSGRAGLCCGRLKSGLLSGRGLCCSAGERWTAEWGC